MSRQELIEKIGEKRERLIEEANSLEEQVLRGYELTKDEIVKPGFYNVVESDYGGYRDITQFNIEVTQETTLKDLFIKLYFEANYISPWGYLRIDEYQPKAKYKF